MSLPSSGTTFLVHSRLLNLSTVCNRAHALSDYLNNLTSTLPRSLWLCFTTWRDISENNPFNPHQYSPFPGRESWYRRSVASDAPSYSLGLAGHEGILHVFIDSEVDPQTFQAVLNAYFDNSTRKLGASRHTMTTYRKPFFERWVLRSVATVQSRSCH